MPYLAPVTGALPLRLLFLQGSNKKVPPATQLMRVKQPGSHSAMKREKRFSTSSFPLSANREIQKLPALAGMPSSMYSISIRQYHSFSSCCLQMQLHYIFLLCNNSHMHKGLLFSWKMLDDLYLRLHVWPTVYG